MKLKPVELTYILLCSAMLFLALERSAEMYITVDEAITYTDHIRPKLSGLFDFSAANNHFLNTLLAKIATTFAPYSELALRLPNLLIGAWFFLVFARRRISSSWQMLLFASVCLYPYVISEYWSLSRGYFMSGCFGAAALIELTTKDANRFSSAKVLSALAALASFVMLPFAILTGVYSIYKESNVTPRFADNAVCWRQRLNSFAWLFSLGLAIYGIYTFKTSGEALAYSSELNILAPITATAYLSGSKLQVWLSMALLAMSGFLIYRSDNRCAKVIMTIVGMSVGAMLVGGVLGTGFPVNRSWLPFWFPIAYVISFIIKIRPAIFSKAITIILSAACLTNNLYWYSPDFVLSWRSNYYQARALHYYSSKGTDFCLEETYKGDRVLIYYWDDPKSAIIEPRSCSANESSPVGFTNFEVPGRMYYFPEKMWGKYRDNDKHVTERFRQ